MNFTKELPTKPGFYAWRRGNGEEVEVAEIYKTGDLLRSLFAGDRESFPVGNAKGEWCRLVPAEEQREAWLEGAKAITNFYIPIETHWQQSRAKRVMEGEE